MKPKPRGGEGKGERWWHPWQWKASWRSALQPARGPGGALPTQAESHLVEACWALGDKRFALLGAVAGNGHHPACTRS